MGRLFFALKMDFEKSAEPSLAKHTATAAPKFGIIIFAFNHESFVTLQHRTGYQCLSRMRPKRSLPHGFPLFLSAVISSV